MDEYKDIRAYRVGWLLQVTDWFTIMPFLMWLRNRTSASLTLDMQADKDDLKGGAVFMSNHRDIVMDAAWLSLLLRTKWNIRPYMGIGTNLYGRWWIEPLCKLMRCFSVIRGGSPRELLQHSQHLSAYIQSLRHRKKSIWIAQREGRAKDRNDSTQDAVIKMLILNNPQAEDVLTMVRRLNICPTCINYEFDPCDYLKAQEMQLKRDNPDWKKTKDDDVFSMKTGIYGYKGRVVYRITPSINHWLDQNEEQLRSLNRNQQLRAIAERVDYQIHSSYEIYERGNDFDRYIEQQLQKIQIPDKDTAFLREKLYEMYSNPVKNYQAVKDITL